MEQFEKDLRNELYALVFFNDNVLRPTIADLLEPDGKFWGEFPKLESREKPSDWTWFHLPAVHRNWLQELAGQLQHQKVFETWGGIEDTPETFDWILYFLHQTFGGDRIISFSQHDDARDSENATFSVAMPFLDSENYKAFNDPNNKMSQLEKENAGCDGPEATGLIPSRALDEAFYVTEADASAQKQDRDRDRDRGQDQDQVVYRYYQRYRESKFAQVHEDIQHRILTVSPLRLWKIGRGVVITALPTAKENDWFGLTTLDHVYHSVDRSQPATSMELVLQIMASLVTTIDGPHYAGLHESLLTIFESVTSAQTKNQLKLYEEFRNLLNERISPPLNTDPQPTTNPAEGSTRGTNQPSRAITLFKDEMECFRVVMDIRDELAMISSIILEQERVMQTVTGTIGALSNRPTKVTRDRPTDTKGKSKETDSEPKEAEGKPREITGQIDEVKLGIVLWKSRISNIDKRAQMVEKALNHLLSLQVGVSNLAEAEDAKHLQESSRRLLESSNKVLNSIDRLQKSSQDIQDGSKTLLESNNKLLTSIDSLQKSGQVIQNASKTILQSNNDLLKSIDSLQKTSKKLKDKADKQSRYLFAFTVVTVIFAPLSFVTSFFAIPSRDFPQDEGVSWSQSQIGGGLAISLLMTIVLVILTVMVNDYTDASDAENGSTHSDTSV